MKFLLALLLLFSASCFSKSIVATRENYDAIYTGTSVSELEDLLGSPYAVHKVAGGEEYEYVETFSMDNELIQENHYFFTIVNGKVVAKRITHENRPPYDLMYQEDPNYPTYP